MQTINTNPGQGITVVNGSAYFSLGSNLWTQTTQGQFAKYTYSYAPPSPSWDNLEMATMSMARWGGNPEDKWYSACMRLEMALGFGAYEQSLKVGAGSGVTTTFYLSEQKVDKLQEIDLSFPVTAISPASSAARRAFGPTSGGRGSSMARQRRSGPATRRRRRCRTARRAGERAFTAISSTGSRTW